MRDRVIVDCRNLLGDTIYLIKPLRQYLTYRRPKEVALGIASGLPGEIVQRSFLDVPVEPIETLEAAWPDADRITLSAMAAWLNTRSDNGHISRGYARILGMELGGGIDPDLSWLPPPDPDRQPRHISVAPFSVSCARHRGEPPNKTLDEADSLALVELLRGFGLPLRVIGGADERFVSPDFGFVDADYFSATGIDDLISFLRQSALVVGVDTGVCHASSCAGIPTIVLWPSAVSRRFIGETWARRTRFVPIGSPANLDRHRVAGLLAGLTRGLLNGAGPGTATVRPGPLTTRPPRKPVFPALDSATFRQLRKIPPEQSTWSAHLPFARDLLTSLRPCLLVELGTQLGESYFGFCQSVAETGGGCTCYAVDPWQPDADPGEQTVYADVERHNSEHYSAFSHLLRMHAQEALEWFADGSIDLLHLRTPAGTPDLYGALKLQFESWYPKLAPGGVMLLDGTRGNRLWQERLAAHGGFEFHGGSGLGVIRKPGGDIAIAGILKLLFEPENAAPIREYYAGCGTRPDQSEEAVLSAPPAYAGVAVDPPSEVVSELMPPLTADQAPDWIDLALDDPGLHRNEIAPKEDEPGTWQVPTSDPWIICPVQVDPAAFRFFLVEMSCTCAATNPIAQLFWSGPQRLGFDERRSVSIPLIADGRPHTYVVDLHAGKEKDALNSLWWHRGILDTLRFDPLDTPGEFRITRAGLAQQDAPQSEFARQSMGLRPLRSELSYRYLIGAGMEIGASHGPLELRPDAYIQYADRFSAEEARSRYPELQNLPLVNPTIICAPDALAPVADRSLDFVVAIHILEQVPDPALALGEWLRVVRPGGHVFVAVMDEDKPTSQGRKIAPRDPSEGDLHAHCSSRSSFAALLDAVTVRVPSEVLELRRGGIGDGVEYVAILRKS